MDGHTKEPWSVLPQVDDPYEPIRIYGGHGTIAKLWLDDAPVEDYNLEQYANAKRIVDCVNACAGIPSSILSTPGYSIKAELDNLDKQINMRMKAEQQRRKLIDPLVKAKNILCGLGHDTLWLDEAIAKAEGR